MTSLIEAASSTSAAILNVKGKAKTILSYGKSGGVNGFVKVLEDPKIMSKASSLKSLGKGLFVLSAAIAIQDSISEGIDEGSLKSGLLRMARNSLSIGTSVVVGGFTTAIITGASGGTAVVFGGVAGFASGTAAGNAVDKYFEKKGW